jgi:hypothetical protein
VPNCGKQFNQRSNGALNRASVPSDIIAFVVFCRLRFRLTLRDLSEILLLPGFTVSHECVRQWEAKLLPVMGEALRKRRHGTGRSSARAGTSTKPISRSMANWCQEDAVSVMLCER